MKSKIPAIVAAFLCCLSCVEVNSELGGSLIPIEQTYKVFTQDIPLEEISVNMADSLSGFSQTRVTIGSIDDEDFGLTTRSSAITLIPMFNDKLDFGKNPVLRNFHFSIVKDTTNVADESQTNIIQNIRVYELEEAPDAEKMYDTNGSIKHKTGRITKGTPIYSGGDSLSFNFNAEFAERFLTITEEETKDIDKYLERFPGIFIETDKPAGGSGRINLFDLQLSYDSQYYYLDGNYARLSFESEYEGKRKDTSFVFYLGALDFFDIDSLLTKGTKGKLPQYCLNLTGHQTREREGLVTTEYIPVEGGGGLKPVISAKYLKKLAEEAISKQGGDPSQAVVNKASLVFPFEFPENWKDMDRWPDFLSPTCKIVIDDQTTSFMGLTDSSSQDENQGDLDRSNFKYAPDITYHMQELLKIDESKADDPKTQRLNNGDYDVWFLIMANEVTVSENTQSSEMSDYYNYLAYQSYYNSMYGGYGGYGGYGYGGYGYGGYGGYGSAYSNYYTYAMLAQYASSSASSTTTTVELDKDRFYKAYLNGPAHSTDAPRLELTFSIPNRND